MPLTEPAAALARAIQDEADDLGCNGDYLSETLSGMLSRIAARYRRLTEQEP